MVSAEETNTELLEYAPANQKAVRIFRDGDKYYSAVFCNYLIDDTESLPFDEVFKVYGISKAEDIKSIVSVKTDNEYINVDNRHFPASLSCITVYHGGW